MNLVDAVKERRKQKSSIVLPETDDLRVLQAATFLAEEGICNIILIGIQNEIETLAEQRNLNLPKTVQYLNFQNFDRKQDLIDNFVDRQKHKGVTTEEALQFLSNPLYFAASLVALGVGEGCVAGSVSTTSEVIRAAIKCIGLSPNSSIVSSTFLMELTDNKTLTYGDCGVVPYPDASQLADIAIDSANTHQLLTREEAKVAMLSFSTKGSAEHEKTELVIEALEIAKERAPDLIIDGELQFDAAFVPEIAKRKAPNSKVAGKANVLIFPNLDAGNIAYKITERLAGANATGPILQGLKKPLMDLSRGCDWRDIVNAACVAILVGEDQ